MGTLYLLADETMQNQQQEDCRLIAQVRKRDNQALHKAAEVAVKEKFSKNLPLMPISEQAANLYLQADPSPEDGSLNLMANVPLFWHLVRIK
jgi:hypothetical protein